MIFGDYFTEAYLKLLKEKAEVVKDAITSGKIASMEEYRYSVGRLLAYEEAMQLLRECYANFFDTKTIYSGRDEDGERFED